MAWLAESLGIKGNETPDETIRRYLASRFFKDHLQTYKKRPIYWLFSSGKQGAFQALVYLHRYHEGTLARMRAENGLAPAELGEIDPASATMKFATLGMRPVAVSWLWHKANEYKKFKDWDKLEATVEQIIRLQPNDLEVWDFQAHNLSYNVSVEFDDYR